LEKIKNEPEKNDYWRYQSKDGKQDYIVKVTKVVGDRVRGCPVKKITHCVPMMFLVTIGWTIFSEPDLWTQVTWPDLKPVTVFHKLDKGLKNGRP